MLTELMHQNPFSTARKPSQLSGTGDLSSSSIGFYTEAWLRESMEPYHVTSGKGVHSDYQEDVDPEPFRSTYAQKGPPYRRISYRVPSSRIVAAISVSGMVIPNQLPQRVIQIEDATSSSSSLLLSPYCCMYVGGIEGTEKCAMWFDADCSDMLLSRSFSSSKSQHLYFRVYSSLFPALTT